MLLPVPPFLFVSNVFLLRLMTLTRMLQVANYRLFAFGIKHRRVQIMKRTHKLVLAYLGRITQVLAQSKWPP